MGFGSRPAVLAAAVMCFVIFQAGPAACAGSTMHLDIDRCVDMALEANVSVVKAGYDLDYATNSVIYSISGLLPTVSVSSSHYRSEGGPIEIEGTIIETGVNRSYTASLSLQETVSPSRFLGVFESLADSRAAGHSLRSVRLAVAFTAKQKYLEVLKAGRLLEVRQEAQDLSNRRLEKAEALLEVGSAVRSEVLRAQVEVSRDELDLISARNALRLADTDLKHYLRIEDHVAVDLEDILETADRSYTLEQELARAIEARPDIKYGAANLKASRLGVWRERGGWMPYVSFSGGYDHTGESFPDETSALWDKTRWSWSLRAGINLFDGLATFSRVRMAKAMRNSAREDLLQIERDAALEVKQAFYNVEEARQRVKVSRETVGLAEEELRLAEERYRLGGGTMLEQIDAHVALSEARTSYVEALYDYLLSQAQLEQATGESR